MNAYFRLLRFVRPYRARFAFAIFCMIVFAATSAAYATLMGPLLAFLFNQGDPGSFTSLEKFLPSGLDFSAALAGRRPAQILALLPWVIVGVSLLKGAAAFGQFYLMGMLGQRVVVDLRRALFDHLLGLSPAFFTRRHSGDLMSRFAADIGAVEVAITNSIASYLRDGLTVVVMLATLFYLDWQMSLVVFGVIPITLIPVVRLGQRLKKATVSRGRPPSARSRRWCRRRSPASGWSRPSAWSGGSRDASRRPTGPGSASRAAAS